MTRQGSIASAQVFGPPGAALQAAIGAGNLRAY